jgi:hypothetical protein
LPQENVADHRFRQLHVQIIVVVRLDQQESSEIGGSVEEDIFVVDGDELRRLGSLTTCRPPA